MSLPSPLTASDEYTKPKESGAEIVRVSAGLHRQVWVSGTTMFVDVHIANSSKRSIKRLDLQLERDLLCYKHVHIPLLVNQASPVLILSRSPRPPWRNQPVKHAFLIVTSVWSSARLPSNRDKMVGMAFPLTQQIRGLVILNCLEGMLLSNVVCEMSIVSFC
jgi:hypothetical protein